jgi:hypothetical protein
MKSIVTAVILMICVAANAQESKILLDAVNKTRHNLGLPDLTLNTSHQHLSDSILDGMIDYYSFTGEIDTYKYADDWSDGLYIYEADDMGFMESYLTDNDDFLSYVKSSPEYKSVGVSVTCDSELCMAIISFYN